MPVTGQQVADLALALLFHTDSNGNADQSAYAKYYGSAPAFLTALQYELAEKENAVPAMVNDLTQALVICEDSALRVMPCGLAMYFALAEHDADLYNHFSQVYYGTLVPSIKPCEAAIFDAYEVAGDPTMR